MNLKDYLDIEPEQKNIIIVFIGVFSISFLQLFIFKNELINSELLNTILITLSLSFFWFLINSASLFLFISLFVLNKENKVEKENQSVLTVLFLGFLGLIWIYLLTYISYLYEMTFVEFIEFSVIVSIIRTTVWLLCLIIKIYLKK